MVDLSKCVLRLQGWVSVADTLARTEDLKDVNARAIWEGAWLGPSSPCHRRIDILIYPFWWI